MENLLLLINIYVGSLSQKTNMSPEHVQKDMTIRELMLEIMNNPMPKRPEDGNEDVQPPGH